MRTLNIPDLINKKKNGDPLDETELSYFVECVCNDSIDRSQIGAILMAFCLRGLNVEETISLTKLMKDSGTVQTWDPTWRVVDKHSTGGVGDKVTFPLVAAVPLFGLKIPMISGRGLSHTGGTVDKLESIPGFSIALSDEKMRKTLADIGCYITVQSEDIAPADKTLYSIRDITSTVCYGPLICASIMSKKLAEGIQSLVLDVKTGEAATTPTLEQTEWLARMMIEIGESSGVKTTAVITEMETPIGHMIGNSLEIIESIECIKGNGPEDLEKITAVQGGTLLFDNGVAKSQVEGEEMIRKSFRDGSALGKFLQILSNQGVLDDTIEHLRNGEYDRVFEKAKFIETIVAKSSGHITKVNALALGRATVLLGGGRQRCEDIIDPSVGIRLLATKGHTVTAGDVIAEVHHNGKLTGDVRVQIEEAFTISNSNGGGINRIHSVMKHNLERMDYATYRNQGL